MPICIICFDSGAIPAPCVCKGSVQFIHPECVFRRDRFWQQCTVCKSYISFWWFPWELQKTLVIKRTRSVLLLVSWACSIVLLVIKEHASKIELGVYYWLIGIVYATIVATYGLLGEFGVWGFICLVLSTFFSVMSFITLYDGIGVHYMYEYRSGNRTLLV
jgi:hypothetical protein